MIMNCDEKLSENLPKVAKVEKVKKVKDDGYLFDISQTAQLSNSIILNKKSRLSNEKDYSSIDLLERRGEGRVTDI